MRTTAVVVIAVFTSLMMGVTSVPQVAADPTQADFDACNLVAQSKAATPSASIQGRPQTGMSSQPSGIPPQAAPSPERVPEARGANQADQLHRADELRGIPDKYKDDVAYQQAYRDCMKRRGF